MEEVCHWGQPPRHSHCVTCFLHVGLYMSSQLLLQCHACLLTANAPCHDDRLISLWNSKSKDILLAEWWELMPLSTWKAEAARSEFEARLLYRVQDGQCYKEKPCLK